ncbi:MAG: sigma-70 family RNA polymerase sigma factor [Microbacterium sp.]|nr:sigma-70 family RNA polymerase sigma factor [Microbacterium sp.]
MEDPRSDAELLRQLRDGERDAYVVLWERHIGAALRYASRLFPSRAEDLASEAFLAVYQQVTTSSNGPEFAFRSYLKAVIRNIAVRWRKDADHVDDTVEADRVDTRDALSLVAREADAGELLGAFLDLPERWQRVLWLAEVADVARPDIARELGIKPNAVSALQRRARSGLKVQWLTRQVPVLLRDDATHAAARLFPAHLSDPLDTAVSAQVSAHVDSCASCAELLVTMRSDARRLQSVTLSAVGFGALGAVVPAGASLAPGTAAAAITLVTGAGIGGLILGGVGALSVGGLLLASLFGVAPPAVTVPDAAAAAVQPQASGAPVPVPTPVPTLRPDPQTTTPEPLRLGRRNADPTIESVDLVNDPTWQGPPTPTRPEPAGVGVPGPSDVPTTADGPGLATPTAYSGYLPPLLTGKTAPGSSVAVELGGRRYTPPVAADGSWSFDPRALTFTAGSTYDYLVWSYDASTQSVATPGSFTVSPVAVAGFEGLSGFHDMVVEEASTTGLVISLTGPANGAVSMQSMTGHSVIIPLGSTGQVVKRLRMYDHGWYWFTIRPIDADGFWGSQVERGVDVYDPDIIFDPFGSDGDVFDVVDP